MKDIVIDVHYKYYSETLKEDIKSIHKTLIHELFHAKISYAFKIGSRIEIFVDKERGKCYGKHYDYYPNRYRHKKYFPLIIFIYFISFIYDVIYYIIFTKKFILDPIRLFIYNLMVIFDNYFINWHSY